MVGYTEFEERVSTAAIQPHHPKRKPAAKASPQPVASVTGSGAFGWYHHLVPETAMAPSGPSVTTTSGAPARCSRRTAASVCAHVGRRSPPNGTPAIAAASRWLQMRTSTLGRSSRKSEPHSPAGSVCGATPS